MMLEIPLTAEQERKLDVMAALTGLTREQVLTYAMEEWLRRLDRAETLTT